MWRFDSNDYLNVRACWIWIHFVFMKVPFIQWKNTETQFINLAGECLLVSSFAGLLLSCNFLYGVVYILPQKALEREFIHVISFAENFYFITYSSNEFSVQIRWITWSHVKTQIIPHRKLNFTTFFRIKVSQWLIMW